jgi:hypothetical protein
MHSQASGTLHAWTATDCSHDGPVTACRPAPRRRAGRRAPCPLHPVAHSQSARLSRSRGELSHAFFRARLLRAAPLSAAYKTRLRSASWLSRSTASRAHARGHKCVRARGYRPTVQALLDPTQRVCCARAKALRTSARWARWGGRPHLSLPRVRRMLRASCAPRRRAAQPPAPGAPSLVVQERLMLRAHGAARAPDRAVALEAAAKGELPDAVAALDALPRPPRALSACWHAAPAGPHDCCNMRTGP